MPAQSQQQQKFMGMVHALNKGDIKPSDVSKSTNFEFINLIFSLFAR